MKASVLIFVLLAAAACGAGKTTETKQPATDDLAKVTAPDRSNDRKSPKTKPSDTKSSDADTTTSGPETSFDGSAQQQKQQQKPQQQKNQTQKQQQNQQQDQSADSSFYNGPKIAGLGSKNQKPEELTKDGYNQAIIEANFCRETGKFSNGLDCYVVYQDGRTEWVNDYNKLGIYAFIEELKKQRGPIVAPEAEKNSGGGAGKVVKSIATAPVGAAKAVGHLFGGHKDNSN